MRLYRDKSYSRYNKSDFIRNVILCILLITGLLLCPKGDLYNIEYSDLKFYTIGILLVMMSIMYFLVNLIVSSELKRKILRFLAVIILVTNTVISMIFISLGGNEVIVGLAIFNGTVIGVLLNCII